MSSDRDQFTDNEVNIVLRYPIAFLSTPLYTVY